MLGLVCSVPAIGKPVGKATVADDYHRGIAWAREAIQLALIRALYAVITYVPP
jgi:hypothetical protein